MSVKRGVRKRFGELGQIGIRTVMITGDNPLTAAAIAAEAGIDDFLAQANAGRYARAGTPVTVRAERHPGALTLAIVDEGPGLPVGKEGSVFETFRRLEGSDRTTGGTGLGLAIVKGFAAAMGLSVAAANREDGRGARFGIVFPEALLVAAGAEANA